MLKEVNPGEWTDDEGFSIHVRRDWKLLTLDYVEENKRLICSSERYHDEEHGHHSEFDFATMRWEPPHEDEVISAEKRRQIADRILQASRLMHENVIARFEKPTFPRVAENVVEISPQTKLTRISEGRLRYESNGKILVFPIFYAQHPQAGVLAWQVHFTSLRTWTEPTNMPISADEQLSIHSVLMSALPLLGIESVMFVKGDLQD